MADEKRLGISGWLALLVVGVTAAGARVGYLYQYADQARNPGPLQVQTPPATLTDLPADTEMLGQKQTITEQDALAHNLKEHRWFGSLAPFSKAEEQTAHLAPGYPWLLANVARIVGVEKLAETVRWAQAGLGALAACFLFLFAWQAFGQLFVALLTGLFAAVYPFWVVDVASVTDGVVVSCLLALTLYLGVYSNQTGGVITSLLYGLALAGLGLLRAALLPFSFVALGWYLLASRSESRGWLCALLACLGFFNGLAPWTVRNYQIFHEPLPLVDSMYVHLWVGNNPLADGGPASESMWPSAPGEELREIESQPERYGKLAPLVMDEIKAQPTETIRRRFWSGLYFLFGKAFFTQNRLTEGGADASALPRSPLVFHATLLALFVLAFLGWRWSHAWHKETTPATLAILWIPLPYLLSHAELLHGPRLPLDGVLLCYAAFALAYLIPGVGSGLRDPKSAGEYSEEL